MQEFSTGIPTTKTALRVLFLSNGHGEDAIGAQLARQWHCVRPGDTIYAYPTVDAGKAYETKGPNHMREVPVRILGPRRTMPSGGLLLHSWTLFWADIAAGFVSMSVRQWLELNRLHMDVVVVVGDVYALLLSTLVKCTARYYVQPLVSAYHQDQSSHQDQSKVSHIQASHIQTSRTHTPFNRITMEQFTFLEQWLMRHTVRAVYVRDQYTATHLKKLLYQPRSKLQKQPQKQQCATPKKSPSVHFLGNPIVDMVMLHTPSEVSDCVACGDEGSGVEGHSVTVGASLEKPGTPDTMATSKPMLLLLPGSRHYSTASLAAMLAGLVAWHTGYTLRTQHASHIWQEQHQNVVETPVDIAVAWTQPTLPQIAGWNTLAVTPKALAASPKAAHNISDSDTSNVLMPWGMLQLAQPMPPPTVQPTVQPVVQTMTKATIQTKIQMGTTQPQDPTGAQAFSKTPKVPKIGVAVYDKTLFATLLHRAACVLGTAGTAHEQAVALGVPVVSFALPPQYTKGFLTNQKRLLDAALTISPSSQPAALAKTLQQVFANLPTYQQAAREIGHMRLGTAGGTVAIVEHVVADVAHHRQQGC